MSAPPAAGRPAPIRLAALHDLTLSVALGVLVTLLIGFGYPALLSLRGAAFGALVGLAIRLTAELLGRMVPARRGAARRSSSRWGWRAAWWAFCGDRG